jgi:hypothetical protein
VTFLVDRQPAKPEVVVAGNSIRETHKRAYYLMEDDSPRHICFPCFTFQQHFLTDHGERHRPGQAILGHVAIGNDIEIPVITRKQSTLALEIDFRGRLDRWIVSRTARFY